MTDPITLSRNRTSNDWDGSERISEEPDLVGLSYRTLHRRQVADSTQHLDCSSPISHLPDELLLNVFILALATSSHKVYMTYIASLQLTSKRWNKIFLEAPSLWARTSSVYSDRERRVAILRSKECSLWVDYNDHDFDNDEDRTTFINCAIQKAYRGQLVEFVVSRTNTFALLCNFVSLSVPRLEGLTIQCHNLEDGPAEEGSIDLFGGTAHRLRHANLTGFPIIWSSQILSRLETLKIIETDVWLRDTSSNDIIDVLRRCPELHSFELNCPNRTFRVSGVIPETEAAHLPLLTSFDLDLGDAEVLSRIIASVRIPACTKLYLACDDPTSNIFSHHIMTILSSAIRPLAKIELWLSISYLVLSG
ncbi:hypothetical protein FRB94_004771 [Tulasnella sp. JGI-2019a]|nr:hypothetical protein FRB94_004771 [Tulasnella sp. JGI-2019a]